MSYPAGLFAAAPKSIWTAVEMLTVPATKPGATALVKVGAVVAATVVVGTVVVVVVVTGTVVTVVVGAVVVATVVVDDVAGIAVDDHQAFIGIA